MPQEMFVSYWTLEPGWSTQLEIRNNVAQRDLTVTPVLRTSAGAEIALQSVTIPPEHVIMVDLRETVLSIAPELLDRADSFGSVVYRYNANSESNLFAASMVQRSASPIGFHFDGEPLDKGYDSGSVESIWWMPSPTASEYLILGNASTRPLLASVSVSDPAGRSSQRNVELGPAQTRRVDLRAITQAARFGGLQGGITVSVRSGAGNLLTSHIVFDESTGLSAMMKTFERNPAEKPGLHTLRGPMMALTTPDPALMFPEHTTLIPQLFLRNAGNSPLDATVTLDWRSPGGTR